MIDSQAASTAIVNRDGYLEELIVTAIANAAARLAHPGIEYWKPYTSIDLEIYQHFEVVQLQPFQSKLIPKPGVKFVKLQGYEVQCEFEHEWFLVISNSKVFGMLYSRPEELDSEEDGAKIEIVDISRIPEFVIGNFDWFTHETRTFLLSD